MKTPQIGNKEIADYKKYFDILLEFAWWNENQKPSGNTRLLFKDRVEAFLKQRANKK